MKIKEFLRGRKTRWILPVAIVAILAAVLIPTAVNGTTAEALGTESVYKETQVERGDITVGVTESGTASLNTNSVYCYLDGAEIEEMYISSGESVSEGEAVAILTEDSVADVLDTYETALDTAELALEKAEISQTTGQQSALATYNDSILRSQTAETTYEETIQTLTQAVSTAQASVDDSTGTITYYEERLANDAALIYAEYDIDGLKTKLDAANAQVESDIANGYNDPTSPYYSQYTYDVEKQTDAQNSYDTAVSNYESEVTKETSALATKKSGLSTLQNKVSQAKLDLESGTAEAQIQYQEDLDAGDNAQAVYDAAISSLQVDVNSAQTEYDNALEEYETYSVYALDPAIYSDYSGLVMSMSYSAGDTVSSSVAVATITDNSTVYVTVSVTQDDISNIAVGDSANVSFSAYEDTKFTGTVDSITITPAREESSTVSYSISVVITGEGVENIYEGMTGDVTFVTEEVTDVLYVSNKAITTENGIQYAKVLDDAGNTTQVEVTTGFSDGTNTEVTSGLEEGQTVIIESQAVTTE